ncbi:uncharacterized protein BJ171DRAFT_279153 [Polychytrium aggregatum]|uniref:uncharacterized protein n=1 Tax=Polychytrium aggregatum TaxID=110093 RepID=UPI0022FECC83|nr:uncharacterized protein BJ171DRAFT_279153 [Polychytrium aggregatum]KAI9207669.1 hypothetical protein BJ171DRAFT_279153 [Polychytrium aggregatum]
MPLLVLAMPPPAIAHRFLTLFQSLSAPLDRLYRFLKSLLAFVSLALPHFLDYRIESIVVRHPQTCLASVMPLNRPLV